MTSRPDLPEGDDGASPKGQDQARSIPDGGLGSSMPAWLRQPPAWKRTATVLAGRSIPPPDTSTIDPRTMLEIDDLPQWLQAVARRESGRDATAAEGLSLALEVEPELQPSSPNIATRGEVFPTHPKDSHVAIETRAPPPVEVTNSTRPWWMSDGAIKALLVAVILTLVYVVLVASDVI